MEVGCASTLDNRCIQFQNPRSYKSFNSEGIPLQYSVSPEELYDQGILARPSTSGGTGNGINGLNGRTLQVIDHMTEFSI